MDNISDIIYSLPEKEDISDSHKVNREGAVPNELLPELYHDSGCNEAVLLDVSLDLV